MSIDLKAVEQVQMFMKASGLKKMDMFSNTDAYAKLFHVDPVTNEHLLVGTTEVLMNTQDPEWMTSFTFEYRFEEKQEMIVRVYDKDDSRDQLIGELPLTMVGLMRAPLCVLSQDCSVGHFTIRGEPKDNTRDVFVCTFKASKLVNKDSYFDKSDPYLVCYRSNEDGSFNKVWLYHCVILCR